MASFPRLLLLLLAAAAASASANDLVGELQSLRARSPFGVIHLTDTSVTRFLSSPAPRSYSILVFFDATSLHSKSDLHLPQLRREFALLSASFLANNLASASDLFFADIEFSESQHSFSQFGVNSLPHVRLIRPEHSRLADSEQRGEGASGGGAARGGEIPGRVARGGDLPGRGTARGRGKPPRAQVVGHRSRAEAVVPERTTLEN